MIGDTGKSSPHLIARWLESRSPDRFESILTAIDALGQGVGSCDDLSRRVQLVRLMSELRSPTDPRVLVALGELMQQAAQYLENAGWEIFRQRSPG